MKILSFHPLAQEYRRMSEHDLGRMQQDMEENGFDARFPIVVFQNQILDGCNREIAAKHARVNPKYITFTGSLAEAKSFVQRANEERRHLTLSELSERRASRIQRIAVAREDGKSLRAIADEEQVSEKQVRVDLKKATADPSAVEKAGAEGSAPEKVKGKDGKKYPAKKNPLPPRDIPEREPGDDSGAEGEVKDAEGETVPAQAIEAFAKAKEMQAWCREVDGLSRRVTELIKGPGGRLISLETVKQQLQAAKGNVWGNLPTHVCPYCHGNEPECECCKGQGWVAKHIWSQQGDNWKKRKDR